MRRSGEEFNISQSKQDHWKKLSNHQHRQRIRLNIWSKRRKKLSNYSSISTKNTVEHLINERRRSSLNRAGTQQENRRRTSSSIWKRFTLWRGDTWSYTVSIELFIERTHRVDVQTSQDFNINESKTSRV